MQKVHIPFDGFGKTPVEAAEIISNHLKIGQREIVQFIIPAQWAWNVNNVIHPECGLVSLVKRNVKNYNLACFASQDGIGVTAHPC